MLTDSEAPHRDMHVDDCKVTIDPSLSLRLTIQIIKRDAKYRASTVIIYLSSFILTLIKPI
ncbi:hypothetical protein HDC91_003781 [Mucilaginibacter sp. AK015]|nr:hypothetical protein [Mucilaginibacter sp. AK015]